MAVGWRQGVHVGGRSHPRLGVADSTACVRHAEPAGKSYVLLALVGRTPRHPHLTAGASGLRERSAATEDHTRPGAPDFLGGQQWAR